MSTCNVISNYNNVWSSAFGTITALERYNPSSLTSNQRPYVLIGTLSGKLYRFWDGFENQVQADSILLNPSLSSSITGIACSPDGTAMFINTNGHCYRYAMRDVISAPNGGTINSVQDIYNVGGNTGGVVVDTDQNVYIVGGGGNSIYYKQNLGSRNTPATLLTFFGSISIKDLDFDLDERFLYAAENNTGQVWKYDFENPDKGLESSIVFGSNTGLNSASFGNTGILYFNYPVSNYVDLHDFPSLTTRKVAGGTNAFSTDPLKQQLHNPRAVLSVSGGLYLSSDLSSGSELYKITFTFVPRNAAVVPTPQFKKVVCGVAAPGNCKRAIVPFNPREYWGWGSPNRPYLQPDPNIACRPSIVFQNCPTIPPVVQPIPPVPPIPQPVVPTVPTEVATVDFNSRRSGQAENIGNLTTISSAPISGFFRTAPALGPLSEVYAVNTAGVVYKFNTSGGTLFPSPVQLYNIGQSVIAASPCVANTGALVIADDLGTLYRFNSNGDLLWKKSTGQQTFGSPACFTDSRGSVDLVYYSSGNTLYSFNATDGTPVFSSSLPSGDRFSSSLVVGSYILVGTRLGNVYAYSSTNGNILWAYPQGFSNLGVEITSTPYMSSNSYVFGAGSNLYCLSVQGQLQWTFAVSGNIESSPACYVDTLGLWSFFTTTCNVLHGLRRNVDTTFTLWTSSQNIDKKCSPILDVSLAGPYVYGYYSNQVQKYYAGYTSSPVQTSLATFTAGGSIDCKSLVCTEQSTVYVLTLSDIAYRVR